MKIIRNKLGLKWAVPKNKDKNNITKTVQILKECIRHTCREICHYHDNTLLRKIHILLPDITTLTYKHTVTLHLSGENFHPIFCPMNKRSPQIV